MSGIVVVQQVLITRLQEFFGTRKEFEFVIMKA